MKNLIGLALLMALSSLASAAEVAGEVGRMSGTLVAQRADGTIKVMAPKAEVMAGDTLVTSKNGYAQIKLTDGSTTTLRPESNLKIEQYRFQQNKPEADNVVLRLVKGGFRTITGLIGKRGNTDAYQMRTASATIGIRGTDYTARLCADGECAGEKRKATHPATIPTIGRVMLLRGEATAQDPAGETRNLLLGAPIFEGDTLSTSAQSHAVVAFRDGGRITLEANSVFRVEAFRDQKTAQQENVALRLLKGAVRVVTGLIGKTNQDAYKLNVASATIGIRGTGFDVWCHAACAEGENAEGAASTDGAGVYVWDGEVTFGTPQGSIDVGVGQTAAFSGGSNIPQFTDTPSGVENNPAPRPDGVPVDLDKEFGATETDEDGLYITVHDGQVVMMHGDEELDLGQGESGFADETELLRLASNPSFADEDVDYIGDTSSTNPAVNPYGCVVQ